MGRHNRRGIRNRHIFLVDLIFIVVSVFASYALRFELGPAFHRYLPSAYYMLAAALIIKPVVYYLFGLYRRLWIYASVNELKIIVIAVTCASAILSVVIFILAARMVFIGFPRLALISDWLISLVAVGGARFSVRLLCETEISGKQENVKNVKKAFIVGAGDAGVIVCREIQKNPQLKVKVSGFIDDNPLKKNQQIHGIKVLGSIEELSQLIEQHRINEVFFAIPSAPGRVVRIVSDICRKKTVQFRTMPGIYEMLGGKVSINRLREVEITDLLRRDPVKLDQDNIGPILHGKVVLVSGAGGSIGRELCRQIARWDPKRIILLGHGENSVFGSMLELTESFAQLECIPVIADIRDQPRLNAIFAAYKPQIIFHAAAHKHVHLMEINVEEAISNNVYGTKNMVEAAINNGAERFVMISTDKAVRPVNIMGASKRLAENIVLNASLRSSTRCSVVRFGNVLGSRGSVVPIFKAQIRKGGPVTVTDPQMKRYFMTIPEAVYLVLESAGLAENEETFVLDMGEQVRIIDLAEDLIRLSGLEPGRDIEIKFTGIRPGEKLSEDLWNEGQTLLPTIHPSIFKLEREQLMDNATLNDAIEQLRKFASEGKSLEIRRMLKTLIPDSQVEDLQKETIFSL